MGSEDVTLRPSGATPGARGSDEGRLARFGRFIVLEQLGSGGSGVVHRAYDPQLDRSVAVKVLHAGDAALRLVAEARAMAKLRHPNVVAVYDVGEAGDRVWLAMEYVEGGTLRQWLDEEARAHSEVLEVFRQAGRGLAAAHGQGLTHRDFKPDNVMVDASGRAAVTDFGVALPTEATEPTQGDDDAPSMTLPMLGTPVYMSPEQVLGTMVGPASDQFSFGVSLFEALYGRRPFVADSLPELVETIERARVHFPPQGRTGRAVMPWVRVAVARMLARDPAERFASMDEVVEALGGHPRSRRRRAAAILGLAGVAAVGGSMLTRAAEPRCRSASVEASRVWSPARRAELAARVAEAGPEARLMPDVLATLDAWVVQWADGVVDACEATHVREVQSEGRLDARMRCFDRQLARTEAFVRELEGAEPTVLQVAYDVARDLPRADACEDPFELRVPSPEELAAWRSYERAVVHDDLGQHDAGLEAVAAGLEALGDEASAARTALMTVESQLARRKGDHARAERAGREAVLTDLELAGPRRAADAWLELAMTVGTDQGRSQSAEGLLLAAESAVMAVDDSDYRRRLLSVRGTVLENAGRLEEALDALREAAEIARGSADPVDTSVHLHDYATALTGSGRSEDGLALLDEVLALDRRIRPEGHPVFVRLHQNRALALTNLGRHDEALEELRTALRVGAEAFGPEAARLGELHLGIGVAQLEAHRFEAARPSIERAMELWEPVHPPSHRLFEAAHTNLGVIANELGEHERALEHYRSARARAVERQGPGGLSVAILLGNEATTLREMGRFEESLALGIEALAIEEDLSGPDGSGLAYALVGNARSLLELGRHDEAIDAATRAVRLREGAQVGAVDIYSATITLALALAQGDPSRMDEARRWALEAREAFEKTGLSEDTAELLRMFESAHMPP